MRQQIALQLRNVSNHVYTVDQEAVTANEIALQRNRPPKFGSFRCKVAFKWKILAIFLLGRIFALAFFVISFCSHSCIEKWNRNVGGRSGPMRLHRATGRLPS
jgi:hypothetical protein